MYTTITRQQKANCLLVAAHLQVLREGRQPRAPRPDVADDPVPLVWHRPPRVGRVAAAHQGAWPLGTVYPMSEEQSSSVSSALMLGYLASERHRRKPDKNA